MSVETAIRLAVERAGLPPRAEVETRLRFRGRRLARDARLGDSGVEDGATLAKSGVRDGDTVHLTARLAQDLEPEPDPVPEGVPPAV